MTLPRVIVGGQLLLILVGCLVQPNAASNEQVTSYNQLVVQLLTPIVVGAINLLGFLGLWIKSNMDMRANEKIVREAAHRVANTAQETALKLAVETQVARDKVLGRLDETTTKQYQALDKANNTNAKILALQEEAAAARARDAELAHQSSVGAKRRTSDMADAKKPTEVVIVEGPGPDKPLNVKVADK